MEGRPASSIHCGGSGSGGRGREVPSPVVFLERYIPTHDTVEVLGCDCLGRRVGMPMSKNI